MTSSGATPARFAVACLATCRASVLATLPPLVKTPPFPSGQSSMLRATQSRTHRSRAANCGDVGIQVNPGLTDAHTNAASALAGRAPVGAYANMPPWRSSVPASREQSSNCRSAASIPLAGIVLPMARLTRAASHDWVAASRANADPLVIQLCLGVPPPLSGPSKRVWSATNSAANDTRDANSPGPQALLSQARAIEPAGHSGGCGYACGPVFRGLALTHRVCSITRRRYGPAPESGPDLESAATPEEFAGRPPG